MRRRVGVEVRAIAEPVVQLGDAEQGAATSVSRSMSGPVDDPRVYLAAERTFLAWVRYLGVAHGFWLLNCKILVLDSRVRACRRHGATQWPGRSSTLGFGMVCVGVFVCVMAAIRHRAYVNDLERGVENLPCMFGRR